MPDEELFARALQTLASGEPLPPEQIAALSHLERGELAELRRVWDALSAPDRERLLAQMHEVERADFRYDFNAIYRTSFEDSEPTIRRQAVQSIDEDAGTSVLDGLIRLATRDPDPTVREAAVAHLAPFALQAELGELPADRREMIERALLAVLHREDEVIGPRREALAALGYLDSPRVTGEIRRGLGDPELRLSAVRAMGRTANPVWLDTLAGEAAESDPLRRQEAARACGEIADLRAVGIVTELVDDRDLNVRLAAIAALGEIGGDEARDALIYALEDKRPAIREAAEAALAHLELDEEPLGA